MGTRHLYEQSLDGVHRSVSPCRVRTPLRLTVTQSPVHTSDTHRSGVNTKDTGERTPSKRSSKRPYENKQSASVEIKKKAGNSAWSAATAAAAPCDRKVPSQPRCAVHCPSHVDSRAGGHQTCRTVSQWHGQTGKAGRLLSLSKEGSQVGVNCVPGGRRKRDADGRTSGTAG